MRSWGEGRVSGFLAIMMRWQGALSDLCTSSCFSGCLDAAEDDGVVADGGYDDEIWQR